MATREFHKLRVLETRHPIEKAMRAANLNSSRRTPVNQAFAELAVPH